jgi:hypothetical protein
MRNKNTNLITKNNLSFTLGNGLRNLNAYINLLYLVNVSILKLPNDPPNFVIMMMIHQVPSSPTSLFALYLALKSIIIFFKVTP